MSERKLLSEPDDLGYWTLGGTLALWEIAVEDAEKHNEMTDCWSYLHDAIATVQQLLDEIEGWRHTASVNIAEVTVLQRMVQSANEHLKPLLLHPCADHDCRRHAWWDPDCLHEACTHANLASETA